MSRPCIAVTAKGRCPGVAYQTTPDDCGLCLRRPQPHWPALADWKHRHYVCRACSLAFAVAA
jgi:hypothetical protein